MKPLSRRAAEIVAVAADMADHAEPGDEPDDWHDPLYETFGEVLTVADFALFDATFSALMAHRSAS